MSIHDIKALFKGKNARYTYGVISGLVVILLGLSYYFQFIKPHIIHFSYAQETCIPQFLAFPDIQKVASGSVSVELKDKIRIGSFAVASRTLCVRPTQLSERTSVDATIAPFGGWFAKRTYAIEMPDVPRMTTGDIARDKVPITSPITFTLTKPDAVSEYTLEIAGDYESCKSVARELSCDLAAFSLEQNQKYAVSVHRKLGSTSQTVARGAVTTVTPLALVDSTIKDGETRYDKPRTIELTFNKSLDEDTTASLVQIEGDKTENIAIQTKVQDTKLLITVPELKRQVEYRVTLKGMGSDGSVSLTPIQLNFKTSGGPKVAGISIGTSGVPRSSSVVIRFDQPIDQNTAIANYIKTSGVSNSGYTIQDSSVSFQINGGDCQQFSINVASGIKSGSNDEVSSVAWSYASRIICGYTWTIGYSVQGRPIVAYSIGSGGKVIMFTGGMHGSEPSGYQTMQAWAEYLRSNPDAIPGGVRVVVVPNTNPDGIARTVRDNARGVNIDRNFPDSTWQSDITSSNGMQKGGGGPTPASEPETKAIMQLTRELRPRLQVSFHAQGRLVGSNNVADADAIGRIYANATGYSTMFTNPDEVMGYDITGQYEMWEAEELGLPAILIELPTPKGNYLTSQLTALKLMLKV